MGKSQKGAVWLNANMQSHYEFWQFWRNTSDADVGRFLKLYTELPLDECNRLGSLQGSDINQAKITLANEVSRLCHGADAAIAAEATASDVFEKGGRGDTLPSFTIPMGEMAEPISAAQLFVRCNLVKSGKEAKRLIQEGGARINDTAVTDPAQMFSTEDLKSPLKLTAGRKRHALISAV
jgi:tyrosyl-tRNA synthetase